jgi:hypothetical protein
MILINQGVSYAFTDSGEAQGDLVSYCHWKVLLQQLRG